MGLGSHCVICPLLAVMDVSLAVTETQRCWRAVLLAGEKSARMWRPAPRRPLFRGAPLALGAYPPPLGEPPPVPHLTAPAAHLLSARGAPGHRQCYDPAPCPAVLVTVAGRVHDGV